MFAGERTRLLAELILRGWSMSRRTAIMSSPPLAYFIDFIGTRARYSRQSGARFA